MNGLKVNQDKIKNGMGMGDFGQKAKQIKLPIRNQRSKIWKKGLVWVSQKESLDHGQKFPAKQNFLIFTLLQFITATKCCFFQSFKISKL